MIHLIKIHMIDNNQTICNIEFKRMNIFFEARVVGTVLDLTFDDSLIQENKMSGLLDTGTDIS